MPAVSKRVFTTDIGQSKVAATSLRRQKKREPEHEDFLWEKAKQSEIPIFFQFFFSKLSTFSKDQFDFGFWRGVHDCGVVGMGRSATPLFPKDATKTLLIVEMSFGWTNYSNFPCFEFLDVGNLHF